MWYSEAAAKAVSHWTRCGHTIFDLVHLNFSAMAKPPGKGVCDFLYAFMLYDEAARGTTVRDRAQCELHCAV